MTKKVTNDIVYVGVNDHNVDLFEGMYDVPDGMAYNSYVILDEKTAILDTVDAHFTAEWLKNVKSALNGKSPDYLIIQHMEPDHSANILNLLKEFPNVVLVGNSKTFVLMNEYFPNAKCEKLVVKEGEVLSLGKHELTFVFAPMVHWPEVMLTYDKTDKVLFSADAFGKFGALDVDADWACEARRYYFGIVGKYGAQVQALLKKLSSAELNAICPLHGPVLTENLSYYVGLYDIWSSYGVETDGVCIAYTSVYGHTKEAALLLADELKKAGCPKVAVNDLARCDMAEAVEDAFRYGKLVLATTTYNAEIFPFMRIFIDNLVERGYKNRTIGFIENGTWAPMAMKVMKSKLDACKNLTYLETSLTIRAAMTLADRNTIRMMVEELL